MEIVIVDLVVSPHFPIVSKGFRIQMRLKPQHVSILVFTSNDLQWLMKQGIYLTQKTVNLKSELGETLTIKIC